VLSRYFHNWEHQLATVDTNRVVRPFDWGLEWLGLDPADPDPAARLTDWARQTVAGSDRFFGLDGSGDFDRQGDLLQFPSAIQTPFPENNVVTARVFPARERPEDGRRRAVVVLPQWNADASGHVGLCQLFARFGLTAVRLSLPYHDRRRPAELERADYICSSNLGRTLQANRQAVLDARRLVGWLQQEGYDRIGIMGTSLGSCLSMLTMAHEPRLKAGAFNHVSPYFADVVWRGLSTRHVRAGFDGHLELERLRDYWMPISPWPFIERLRGRKALLVYARYDLTFPVDLSRDFIRQFKRLGVAHSVGVLPCGHYTTGKPPFSYLDAFHLTRFFLKNL
jgi:hypothetical protein